MPAADEAQPEVWTGPEGDAQDEVVLEHEAAYLALSVPVTAKRVLFPDCYERKPRTWLRIESLFVCMLSSYPRSATVSIR